MTIQQEQQESTQLNGSNHRSFRVPTPQRVEHWPEFRMVFVGLPIAVTLAVFAFLPNHGLTPSGPAPTPTSVVHISNH